VRVARVRHPGDRPSAGGGPGAGLVVRVRDDRPVVAVESAVLAAGLPADARADAVGRIRAAVVSAGAAAAFVGVVGGRPVVGLDDAELERLGPGAAKATTRDLAAAAARGLDAGTTVAATAFLARRAGVAVVLTGGIGGAHARPGPADVSADLVELARTRVCVVCSGPKAFLDAATTLEHLETLGVPVVGLGTDECPGFWTRSTGLRLPDRADDVAAVARRWRAWCALDGPGALLVFVPPPEPEALDPRESERAISRALHELEERGISGPDVTPFLLARVAALTDGRSVRANLALLEANARIAAAIARECHSGRAP
jgi:pseudouridine-5'-phosphate glycosidase